MTIFFYKQVQISRSDIRPHIKWAVSLVILHMVTSISLQGLCGYIWVNILTLSPQRVIAFKCVFLVVCEFLKISCYDMNIANAGVVSIWLTCANEKIPCNTTINALFCGYYIRSWRWSWVKWVFKDWAIWCLNHLTFHKQTTENNVDFAHQFICIHIIM